MNTNNHQNEEKVSKKFATRRKNVREVAKFHKIVKKRNL